MRGIKEDENATDNGAMKVECAGLTDRGRRRQKNQDSILVREDLGLFAVADGVGGRAAGDVASHVAVEALARFLEQPREGWFGSEGTFAEYGDLDEGAHALLAAVIEANRRVRDAAAEEERGEIGTTVAAVLLCEDGMLHIAHVGDSRVYRVCGGEIELLTRDHTVINDIRSKAQNIECEELARLPKHAITRALGISDEVDVEVRSELGLVGDVYLLCSDGLSGQMTDEQIRDVVSTARCLREACGVLVEAANDAGGRDNVSVVLVRVVEANDLAG